MNRSVVRWGLLSILLFSFAAASYGQVAVGISVRFGPPAIPVYAQPICPGPGYFWTPGYWAWNDDGGYYWVPGTWVLAPVGMLWTPGWWGWGGGFYAWHPGYWGPHIGFYGGINYGFGYTGVGFVGGEWRGGAFYYNRAVTNVSVTNVTNVYNRTVIVNENHVSFNGGEGGIHARPTAQEEAYAREPHTARLEAQTEHERRASENRENFAAENHGRPAVAATARAGDFSKHSVVAARGAGGEYHAPAMSPREARVNTPANRGNDGRSNEGFRPFTPPSKNAGNERNNGAGNQNRYNENRGNESRYNENRPNQNRANENRNNENRGDAGRYNENRPQSQPHESRPSNPPRENRSSPAPAKHQNAPPKEEHRAKGR